MTESSSGGSSISRARRIALAVLGVILILMVVAPPDFEAFMAITGWSSELHGGAHKLHIIMRGFGALLLGVGAGLVLILKPSWAWGVAQVWIAAAIAYPAAAALGMTDWPPAFIMPPIAAIVVGAIYWATRKPAGRERSEPAKPRVSMPALAMTGLMAIPLLVYALNEAALQRSSEALHGDLWHWAGSSKMALFIILLGLFAALGRPGWRVPAWGGGLLLVSFGAVSAALPNQASSAGVAWGALAILAGLAFIALVEYERRVASIAVAPQREQPATS
jgi:hypothetical protein